MTLRPNRLVLPLLTLLGTALLLPAKAAPGIDPFYAGSYSIIFNGAAGDVTASYGGLTFKAGDANTLLLMGSANTGSGTLNAVSVIRGAGNHITGFGALSTLFATAANNDGGLVYAPNGTLLYTRYPTNELGQIKPGSSTTDKVVNLSTLSPNSVSGIVGTLQYVPAGFGGAGKLKIISYSSSNWYDATLTDDGLGTYDISVSPSVANVGSGPEGLVYVNSSNPLFSANSLLLSEYGANKVTAYEADANGNPVAGTARNFVTGLTGAEGGTIDPLTGDFVFSTFGANNSIVVVSGFVAPEAAATPEPGTVALLFSLGSLGACALRRRRSRRVA